MSKPICILVSDLHLSHTPPVARSTEESWYAVQAGYLAQLKQIAKDAGDVPVVCAGDIFDRWDAGSTCTNFAIEHLPHMFAVAGQHDLPNHSYADIERSSYWTLMQAEKISNLDYTIKHPYSHDGLLLYGFPWGCDIKPPKRLGAQKNIHLAVVHAYCWRAGCGHPGAEDSTLSAKYRDSLKGYDTAVFGDNHVHFTDSKGTPTIYNCGTFMRRKLDERDCKPGVGILYADGRISRQPLITDQDKFIDVAAIRDAFATDAKIAGFLEYIRNMTGEQLSFEDAVRRGLDKLSPAAADLIREVMG